jgi:hypothetical protein
MAGDAISTPTPAAPLAPVTDDAAPDDAVLGRLEEQIEWYDGRSERCQLMYKWLKFVEIAAAAAIPLAAVFEAPLWVGAVLGTLIVLLAGLQHMNQYQTNWITYRSTCESLKHEKFLYLARARPYDEAANPGRMLGERVEAQISREHARWSAAHKAPSRIRGRETET